jgi:tetrapyrrole methylase family protein/MazG family protein
MSGLTPIAHQLKEKIHMHNSCDKVVEIIDRLLGPGGCPWDREQTLLSLRESVLEEICELIDAVNSGDKEHIQEEIGDLLLNAIFFAKVAEKEHVCTFDGIVDELADKLIRRHPHVFKESKTLTTEGHLKQWDEIKNTEKGKDKRTGVFDGIPASLPALAKAQKMFKRLKKKEMKIPESVLDKASPLAVTLWKTIEKAQSEGCDAEQELRHLLSQIESATAAASKNDM